MFINMILIHIPDERSQIGHKMKKGFEKFSAEALEECW